MAEVNIYLTQDIRCECGHGIMSHGDYFCMAYDYDEEEDVDVDSCMCRQFKGQQLLIMVPVRSAGGPGMIEP